MSVLKPHVPHEAQDETKDGQDDDSKVTASLHFLSLRRGLLIDLSDQAVDNAVVSNVVILESVGVIA